MKANIKLELKTLTPSKLFILLSHVATKMNGNPSFPVPPVSASALRDLSVRLGLAITLATEGSRQSKLLRERIVVEAKDVLRCVADYVRMVAQGDAPILYSSGFELAKPSAAPSPMETPSSGKARPTGRHGELKLRWGGVRNRKNYVVYRCNVDPALPDAEWVLIATTSKITHLVQGLEPYKPYWFCITAVGALDESVRSAPILGRAA